MFVFSKFIWLQGMYTQFAETLWTKITTHVSDIVYGIKQTSLGLDSFNKTFQINNARLSKIILLDAVVSHLYAIYWTEKEGATKSIKQNNSNVSAAISIISSSSSEFVSPGAGTATTPSSSNLSGGPDQSPSICNVTISEISNLDETKQTGSVVLASDELSKDLIIKLLDAMETIKECML